ncbi:glycosyltransferase family 2 protein [Vallitalea sediminicola]
MTIFATIIFCLYVIFQILYFIIPIQTIWNNKKSKKQSIVITEQGISILIPSYNEQLVIKNCIDAIFNLEYSNYETLIINDGSSDNTLRILHAYLELEVTHRTKSNQLSHKLIHNVFRSKKYPNIYVIDKENGGKADALNAGIEYAKNEILITIDADSMLKKDALNHVNAGFQDEDIVAAGGTVHIAQGIKKENGEILPKFGMRPLIRCQVLQYLDSFFLRKITQAKFGSMIVIAGAFGAFKKNILFQVDGYRSTVGEDMDITLKLQKYINKSEKKLKLIYIPEAICYTECPANLRGLFKQRLRWQRAFIDCVIEYWDLLFSGFNRILSYYFLFDSFIIGTLTAFSTVFMLLNLAVHGIDTHLIVILFMISTGIAVSQDILCLTVSGTYGFLYSKLDYVKIILFLPFEILIYRPLGMVFTIIGTISYFFTDHHWGSADRIGKFSIS